MNKAHEHPYGSTVIHTPAGSPSMIPGTLGVAGMKVHAPTSADGLARVIAEFADKIIEHLAEQVSTRVMAKIEEARLLPRTPWGDVKGVTVAAGIPGPSHPTMAKAGISAGFGSTVFGQPRDARMAMFEAHQAPMAIDQTVIDQFSKAHTDLQVELAKIPGLVICRYAPSPLGVRIGAIELVIYSGAYIEKGWQPHVAPDEFLVQGGGCEWRGLRKTADVVEALRRLQANPDALPCECWTSNHWYGPSEGIASVERMARVRARLRGCTATIPRHEVWKHAPDCFRSVDYTTCDPSTT